MMTAQHRETESSREGTDASSAWNQLIGPFYTAASLAALRNVSPQTISRAAARGDILGLRPSDDSNAVFPAFQFGPHGELLPGLREVLAILRKGVDDPWTHAQWLNGRASHESGDTQTNADRLRAGEVSFVLEHARHTAAAWAA